MRTETLPPLREEVAYVSGRYRGSSPAEIWANIMKAREVAMDLWRMGYVALCPHLNTMLFDGVRPDADWLAGDLVLLRRCNLIVMVPGWQESEGARAELREAIRLGLPAYEWAGPGKLRRLTMLDLLRAGIEPQEIPAFAQA